VLRLPYAARSKARRAIALHVRGRAVSGLLQAGCRAHAVNTSRDMTLLSVRARASAAVLAHASLLVRAPPRMTVSSAGPSSSRLSIVMPECAAPAGTRASM